jgi:hypothetical protein
MVQMRPTLIVRPGVKVGNKMNQGKIGFVLLTKWAFESNEDADSPSTISTCDAASEENREGLNLRVDPYTDAINNPDIGSLDGLWETHDFTPEADLVGGWIVETPEGVRKELDLISPGAPSKENLAKSHQLHKMPHPLWL